jgi:hypothetical protein
MLLSDKFPIVNDFVTFIQENRPVKVINRDQWQSFLEFASSDIANYDESSACKFFLKKYFILYSRHVSMILGPVLFDEFVDWKRGGQ